MFISSEHGDLAATQEFPMSFRLPLTGTAAREAMGDLAHVAEVLNPANLHRLVDFSSALRNARRNFPAGAKAVNVICLRSQNDERWLISVGPRGGWKKIWNFGTGRD
jgi:hypothetical protein